MSALPDEPNHFLDWLCRTTRSDARPGDFARRSDFGRYLAKTLAETVADADGVTVAHRLDRLSR